MEWRDKTRIDQRTERMICVQHGLACAIRTLSESLADMQGYPEWGELTDLINKLIVYRLKLREHIGLPN